MTVLKAVLSLILLVVTGLAVWLYQPLPQNPPADELSLAAGGFCGNG